MGNTRYPLTASIVLQRVSYSQVLQSKEILLREMQKKQHAMVIIQTLQALLSM